MNEIEQEPVGVNGGTRIADRQGTTTHSPAVEYKSVIVGLDGREHDADALTLGWSLQKSLGDLGDSLWLVHVISPGPPELEATSTVLEGDVAEVIAEAASRDHVALLYVGSRGYGPLREALFGVGGGGLLQSARCPLVVVPHRARAAVPGRSGTADAGIRT